MAGLRAHAQGNTEYQGGVIDKPKPKPTPSVLSQLYVRSKSYPSPMPHMSELRKKKGWCWAGKHGGVISRRERRKANASKGVENGENPRNAA